MSVSIIHSTHTVHTHSTHEAPIHTVGVLLDYFFVYSPLSIIFFLLFGSACLFIGNSNASRKNGTQLKTATKKKDGKTERKHKMEWLMAFVLVCICVMAMVLKMQYA